MALTKPAELAPLTARLIMAPAMTISVQMRIMLWSAQKSAAAMSAAPPAGFVQWTACLVMPTITNSGAKKHR